MSKLWKTSFSTDLEEYELSIGWDNEAFIDGAVSFTILVEKRDLESGEVIYNRGVQISIDEDENNEPVLRLVCGEETLLEYPLEQLSEVDELIEMIPAWVFTAGIDPMMGCLLRSGISTSVSQIIKIKQETDGASWFLERTAAIGRSLLNSFPEMCGTMSRRAFRCAVNFGF